MSIGRTLYEEWRGTFPGLDPIWDDLGMITRERWGTLELAAGTDYDEIQLLREHDKDRDRAIAEAAYLRDQLEDLGSKLAKSDSAATALETLERLVVELRAEVDRLKGAPAPCA